MNDATVLNRQRIRNAERPAAGTQYTAKDFQLEVLDRLEEMQEAAQSLDESWNRKLEASFKTPGTPLAKMLSLIPPMRGCCDWNRLPRRIPREGFAPKCNSENC